MRKLIGVLTGAVVAMMTVAIAEMIGHRLYPPPAGLDMRSPAGIASYITAAPTGALVAVAVAWLLGAGLGGWTAARIGRWPAAAWIVAALIAIGGVYNATRIPAPLWMQIATVLAPALGGLIAHTLERRRT
ncbi:hypothetical protein ASE86_01905 [Sphingomonas sp. Leaf33]|uniref:hypothetical protein n=1 Tax=Sphingomonas sp. Leaf33 TaxID=1736215 RepID=UPI0006FD9576|nr:hypothetical protein [Sphingomonas sp. Leaf33]KQN25045.1 hypothetical protein ASE86_01905 [Sphingomonas sp. Leaf33]